MIDARRWLLDALLVGCTLVTILIYLVLVPQHGIDDRGIGYFVLGWLPFAIAWYAAGRRFGSPGPAPSMRPVDAGATLVVLALLVSIAFDAWGFTPTEVPEGHVLQAAAIFFGLALFGWGIGRRSAALEPRRT